MKKKIITIIVLLINALLIATTILIIFLQKGIIILNDTNVKKYEVKGIDVSNYQGKIDWNIISQEDIQFAFMKATEGENYIDPYFSKNYQEAKNTALVLGAYHFFSSETDGEKQANNFINAVGEIPENTILLPIVDVEFYNNQNPEPDTIRKELIKFLNKVEQKYKIAPIIYVTQKSYEKYIAENFKEYDLWIRNVWTKPKMKNDRWTFWQYTNKEKLKGYQGQENYIDANVFCGTKQQFKEYVQQKQEKRRNELEKEKPQIESIRGVITEIKDNHFTIQIGDDIFRDVEISSKKEILNKRTEKEIQRDEIKENDFIEIDKIIKIGETYGLLDDTNVYITKDIHGEDLKKEILAQKEFSMTQYELNQHSNGTISLIGNITDDYSQQGEKFVIEIVVTSNTQIMGNTKNQFEELQKLKQRGDILYITLQDEKQNNKLVAKNIEILGC